MYSKAEFFYKFYSMAVSEIEKYKLSSSVAEYLEFEWIKYLDWYKNEYPKKFLESLTLEQLYRFNH